MQRIIPYMFCIGLIGIFMLVIMRKKFIIDYRLHFPSGTATGILISGFHTPTGEEQAKQQVSFNALPTQTACAQRCSHGPLPSLPSWTGTCIHLVASQRGFQLQAGI